MADNSDLYDTSTPEGKAAAKKYGNPGSGGVGLSDLPQAGVDGLSGLGNAGSDALGGAPGTAWSGIKKGAGALGGLLGGLGGGLDNDFQAGYLQPGEGSYNLAQARDRQGAVLDPLHQWALTGQGPSAAQAMLNRSQAQNIAAGMSMAKSMPGATPGAAQYMASQNASQQMLGTGAELAALRSKEQMGAMQMYTQALDAYRRGDIDTYKAAAQAYADAERANAQVAAENAAGRRGLVGGIVEGVAGIAGSLF